MLSFLLLFVQIHQIFSAFYNSSEVMDFVEVIYRFNKVFLGTLNANFSVWRTWFQWIGTSVAKTVAHAQVIFDGFIISVIQLNELNVEFAHHVFCYSQSPVATCLLKPLVRILKQANYSGLIIYASAKYTFLHQTKS